MGEPIILVGMHRSGTSLTALMLGMLGAYIGPECEALLAEAPPEGPPVARIRDGYAESSDFRVVNDAALAAGGSDWCSPERFLEQRDQVVFAQARHRQMAAATAGSLRQGFLRALPKQPVSAWGWKDPRNSLTLPLWLALFPGARVLHVRRDPEAAARSLHRRSRLWQENPPATEEIPSRLTRLIRDPLSLARGVTRRLFPTPPPVSRDRCVDLDYARELCQEYERQCLQARDGGGAMLEVSYEETLSDPLAVSRRLAEFALLDASEEGVRRAASIVRPNRGESRPLW